MATQTSLVFTAILASLLIGPAASPAEPEDSFQDWIPLDMDPKALSSMLGAVKIAGPQVIDLSSTPYRSQGVLEGCGYSYEVFLQD